MGVSLPCHQINIKCWSPSGYQLTAHHGPCHQLTRLAEPPHRQWQVSIFIKCQHCMSTNFLHWGFNYSSQTFIMWRVLWPECNDLCDIVTCQSQGRSRSGGLALVQFNLSQAGQGRAQGCLHLVKTDSLHQSLSLCLSYLSQEWSVYSIAPWWDFLMKILYVKKKYKTSCEIL